MLSCLVLSFQIEEKSVYDEYVYSNIFLLVGEYWTLYFILMVSGVNGKPTLKVLQVC